MHPWILLLGSFRHNCIICTFDSVSGSVLAFFNLSISSSFTFISRLCSATASFTKSSQHISVKKHDGKTGCHSRNDIVGMANACTLLYNQYGILVTGAMKFKIWVESSLLKIARYINWFSAYCSRTEFMQKLCKFNLHMCDRYNQTQVPV